MKKSLMAIVLLLSALMAVQAQETIDVEATSYQTSNVIKLNYGPGLVYSDIYEFNYPKAIRHKASLSLDLSVDYAHTFKNGLGFGLNFIQSHLDAIGCNDLYAGASVYYGYLHNNRWYFDASIGAGYSRNDYGDNKNGVGLFEHLGAHYKFTRHWGVGAEIRSLNCFYKQPDGWEEVVGKDVSFGSKRVALTLGAQYYF